MHRTHVLLVPLAIVVAFAVLACDTNTSPADTNDPADTNTGPVLPAAKRPYDTVRGGLQFTRVYYDQTRNLALAGVEDEWVEIRTNRPLNTTGWKLDAGDIGQKYALPNAIDSVLTVYTRNGPSAPKGQVLTLGLGSWIWNNTEPDTGRIYDAGGAVVDVFFYDN